MSQLRGFCEASNANHGVPASGKKAHHAVVGQQFCKSNSSSKLSYLTC